MRKQLYFVHPYHSKDSREFRGPGMKEGDLNYHVHFQVADNNVSWMAEVVRQMLERAFEAGRENMRSEIRDVLQVEKAK